MNESPTIWNKQHREREAHSMANGLLKISFFPLAFQINIKISSICAILPGKLSTTYNFVVTSVVPIGSVVLCECTSTQLLLLFKEFSEVIKIKAERDGF